MPGDCRWQSRYAGESPRRRRDTCVARHEAEEPGEPMEGYAPVRRTNNRAAVTAVSAATAVTTVVARSARRREISDDA